MASEDVSIGRLRRLMGNQRFEEESNKGKAKKQQEALESAQRAAAAQREAQEEAKLLDIETVDADKSTLPLRLASGNQAKRLTEVDPPNANPPGTFKRQAMAKKKLLRPKPKSSPYSDTEYETDSDAEGWAADDESPPNMALCPVLAIAKYPYRLLSADNDLMERVANAGFNNGQFWERKWTIFYTHPPEAIFQGPLLFVPATEFQGLLDECSKSVGVSLSAPAGQSGIGYQLKFSATEPRPKFLGISYSREDFDIMSNKAPEPREPLNGSWSKHHGDDKSFRAWQAKLEHAVLASKQKKSRNKATARQKRIASRQQWCRQLRRAQRYLGLRAPNEKEAKGATANCQDESAALQEANGIDDPEYPPEIDLSKPPQFLFDQDVVFVSIDIEAHETMQSMMTEVGISTLDTRDLKNVAPGNYAENWRALIKYRHFRISEFRTHVNNRFITGCPDRFEKAFGQSEFVPMSDVHKVISATCKSPFPQDASERAAVEKTTGQGNGYEPRKIVLVGHNFESDVDYLRKSGFQILKLAGLIEVLDTSMIHRALVHEQNAMNLAAVLSLCNIAGWNLHNAGNDAGYTLQALLAMAVDHLANSEHRHTEEQHVQRRETAMRLAREREDSDFQEWLLADRSDPSKVGDEWAAATRPHLRS